MRNITLVEALKERQGDRSQSDFAAEIGIQQGSLSKLYLGYRSVGPEMAAKIIQRFPELQPLVLQTLFRTSVEQSLATETSQPAA